MKKTLLAAVLLSSIATIAQKQELKTLKKIYAKESISSKDLEEYKATLTQLKPLAQAEDEVVYYNFYENMYPTLELASKGANVTPQDQLKVYTPEFIKTYGRTIDETMAFEEKSGKKVFYDELVQEKQAFLDDLNSMSLTAYNAANYKDAANLFYAQYLFDSKNQGKQLENAAISATQAKDYKLAERLYEEFKNSDYLNNGEVFYAVNKASGKEDYFNDRKSRTNSIAIGTHEKPRTEKVSDKKPDVYKTLGMLASINGDYEKAKRALAEAKALSPNDKEIIDEEFNIYFNEAYNLLKDDQKLVDEINANVDNTAKYDELKEKRRALFTKALPSFEKAYEIKPNDQNTKDLLIMAYSITGQKVKADALK